MNCPSCQSSMVPGFTTVHGTFWGFFFAGFSYQHCFFQAYGDSIDKEKLIVRSRKKRAAYRCSSCGCCVILQKTDNSDGDTQTPGTENLIFR